MAVMMLGLLLPGGAYVYGYFQTNGGEESDDYIRRDFNSKWLLLPIARWPSLSDC